MDLAKIKKLKVNKSYIKSIQSKTIKNLKNFTPSNNLDLISEVDVIIICLPTPLIKKTKKPDMRYIKISVIF